MSDPPAPEELIYELETNLNVSLLHVGFARLCTITVLAEVHQHLRAWPLWHLGQHVLTVSSGSTANGVMWLIRQTSYPTSSRQRQLSSLYSCWCSIIGNTYMIPWWVSAPLFQKSHQGHTEVERFDCQCTFLWRRRRRSVVWWRPIYAFRPNHHRTLGLAKGCTVMANSLRINLSISCLVFDHRVTEAHNIPILNFQMV